MSNSTVSGNTSTGTGGIANEDGTLTITDSTISDNKASSNGGGIAISDETGQMPSSVMLLYCTVYGNTAGVGGGIWVANQTQAQMISMGASIVAGN